MSNSIEDLANNLGQLISKAIGGLDGNFYVDIEVKRDNPSTLIYKPWEQVGIELNGQIIEILLECGAKNFDQGKTFQMNLNQETIDLVGSSLSKYASLLHRAAVDDLASHFETAFESVPY